jgi:heme-degrading monooxygenase HmoA
MHLQVVNFSLDGLDPADYERHCMAVAPAFAAMPGLIAKFWLADPRSNTYGGIYVWQDRDAFEDYVASEVFAGVKSNPHLANVTSKDFGILESPSEITRAFQFEAVS